MAVKAPYFSYEELRRRSQLFLDNYNKNRIIPVPIESIVEQDFAIDIIPVPGLYKFDIVAYINQGMNEIYVDDFVYNNRVPRYRFSLAHELGHRILHFDIWDQFGFKGIEEWRQFHREAIPEKEYRFLEGHANCFAGLVLVPGDELNQEFCRCLEKMKAQDYDFSSFGEVELDIIAEYIAPTFEVSADVIRKRIEKDGLLDLV